MLVGVRLLIVLALLFGYLYVDLVVVIVFYLR